VVLEPVSDVLMQQTWKQVLLLGAPDLQKTTSASGDTQ